MESFHLGQDNSPPGKSVTSTSLLLRSGEVLYKVMIVKPFSDLQSSGEYQFGARGGGETRNMIEVQRLKAVFNLTVQCEWIQVTQRVLIIYAAVIHLNTQKLRDKYLARRRRCSIRLIFLISTGDTDEELEKTF